jgi:hypothetical protein
MLGGFGFSSDDGISKEDPDCMAASSDILENKMVCAVKVFIVLKTNVSFNSTSVNVLNWLM